MKNIGHNLSRVVLCLFIRSSYLLLLVDFLTEVFSPIERQIFLRTRTYSNIALKLLELEALSSDDDDCVRVLSVGLLCVLVLVRVRVRVLVSAYRKLCVE